MERFQANAGKAMVNPYPLTCQIVLDRSSRKVLAGIIGLIRRKRYVLPGIKGNVKRVSPASSPGSERKDSEGADMPGLCMRDGPGGSSSGCRTPNEQRDHSNTWHD
jgi:hypothetical protein